MDGVKQRDPDETKKSSPTLPLPNLLASVVETVICRQNSRLYGVYPKSKVVLNFKGLRGRKRLNVEETRRTENIA